MQNKQKPAVVPQFASTLFQNVFARYGDPSLDLFHGFVYLCFIYRPKYCKLEAYLIQASSILYAVLNTMIQ